MSGRYTKDIRQRANAVIHELYETISGIHQGLGINERADAEAIVRRHLKAAQEGADIPTWKSAPQSKLDA